MNLFINFFKILYKIMKVYIIIFLFLILFLIPMVSIFFIGGSDSGNKEFEYVVIDKVQVSDNIDGLSFNVLKKKLEQISKDTSVKGVIINLDDFKISTGNMIDIFDELEKIKENKEVIIYATNMDKNLYLKSIVASKIVMPNSTSALFHLTGYRSINLYYKKFFDKIGVEFSTYKTGESKNYGEELYLENISKAEKESIINMIDYAEKYFYNILTKYRKDVIPEYENDLKTGDNLYSNAVVAHEKGYVDDLMYYEDLVKDLKTINISEYKLVNKLNLDKKLYVINLSGTIGDEITDDKIYSYIDWLSEIKEGEAILININSPGGSAYLSEKIYRIFDEFKKEKNIKIYVYTNTVLASGAYYIAQSADKIFSSEIATIGSVGVVSLNYNISNLLNKLGINLVEINKNPVGNLENIYNKTDALSKKKYEENIKYIYDDFKKVVSENRNIDLNTLENLAGGRTYNPIEAKKINFIDEIMTFNQVVDYIQNEQNEKLNIYVINEKNMDYKKYLTEKIIDYILENYTIKSTYDLKSNILLKEEK